MTKFFKILVSLIGLLVLVVVIAGLGLAMYFDPNDYKAQINSFVYNKTGRHLQINGEIERSFFPWVGVKIHDVQLSNAPGFTDQADFVNISEIDVQVNVIPLFSRKLDVSEIVLSGMDLYLAKDKNGKTNWEDLLNRSQQNDPAPAETQSVPSKTFLKLPQFELEIHDIKLADSNIFWNDAQTGQHSELKHIALRANDVVANKPFSLETHFDLTSVNPTLNGDFTLSSTVTLSPQQQQYRFETLRLAQTANSVSVPKFLLIGDVISADLNAQTLNVSHALLTSENLTATLNLTGEQIRTNPVIKGRIQVTEFNLKNYLKTIGHPFNTQDPAALQRVAISSDILAANNAVKLSNLSATMDDSLIKGEINFSDWAKKVLNFTLDVNQINVDRYMPAANVSAENAGYSGFITSAAAEITAPTSAQDAWSGVRAINANGNIHIGSLTLANTVLTQVTMQPVLQNGILRIANIAADAYQGKMQGEIIVDMRAAIPQYTIDNSLLNVQIGQLLSTDRVTGSGGLKAHLTMQGNTKPEILSSLNGTLAFNVNNGSFVGFDLANMIDAAFQQISRAIAVNPKSLPTQITTPSASNARTDFTQLSGTGVFQNGVFANKDFLLQSPQLKISGNGTANLVSQVLDFHLSALGMRNVANVQGAITQTPRTIALPILVTGTFSKPLIMPDIRALAGTMLRENIQQKLLQINTGTAGTAQPAATTTTPVVPPAVKEKVQQLKRADR